MMCSENERGGERVDDHADRLRTFGILHSVPRHRGEPPYEYHLHFPNDPARGKPSRGHTCLPSALVFRAEKVHDLHR